ncbi:MAG TPA: DUF3048 domain-containing protein [Candidatus Bathyarchaeia archaeon]|nr:DUF3048 domain-containing protein [Candidatus Bathyarchaeia archaeon]
MVEKKNKTIFWILVGIGLYLMSTGLSYATFIYIVKPPEEKNAGFISPLPVNEGREKIVADAPKTEACPLNGGLFSKAERSIWEKRRPLGVMIENHVDSRPQSGLSKADIVYEVVAEGGITRFLAIYFCQAAAEDVLVGPVRSSRTYFLDWISEYGDYPLYAHVGGANVSGKANAMGQIRDYGWVNKGNDLDQFSLSFPTFWRDYERLGRPVATEHTVYSTTDRLWEAAQKRGLTQTDKDGNRWDDDFVSWKHKEEENGDNRGQVNKIEFSFSRSYSDYNVRWEYNQSSNLYSRFNGGQPHMDLDNNQQLSFKVVAIQLMKETGPIDDLKHLLYQTKGEGSALIFQDGQVIKGKWVKKDRISRTIFFDEKGKEIEFTAGPVWIETLPAGNEVSY